MTLCTLIRIGQTFETAHRLPQLGGKCTSLHGHSWRAEVDIVGAANEQGIVIDFTGLKAAFRSWVKLELDHGTMLGAADPLVLPLTADGCKVFRFGEADFPGGGEHLARDLSWPTVENVAELLHRVATGLVTDMGRQLYGQPDRWRVTQCTVHEKHDNAAAFPAQPLPWTVPA